MRFEDQFAISEVIARYSYTWDGKDADGFAQLFVEEGVWELCGPEATQPQARLESRTAIHAWALERFQGRFAGVHTRHHQTGTVFDELTVDAARTRTMVLITYQGATEAVPHLAMSGVYYDQWRKTQVGWQFVQRTLRHDRSTP
jgi:uncharacterized protein (TIGR02246 family)